MFQPAEVTTRDDKPFGTTGAQVTRPRSWKRWALVIGILLVIFLVLAGTKFFQIFTMIQAGKHMVPPPEAVTSAKAEETAWQPVSAAVGTLVAMRGVTLSAEVTGTVREIGFENGAAVQKGQLLVRLDTSVEQAQLESAVADAALAKLTLDRARSLRAQEVNTQAELETADARATQTAASVTNLRAVIAKKAIRAPFDGRVGIRQVELGQVVSPGSAIVSLQTVSPIYAEFQLPQQSLAEVKVGQQISLKVDVFPADTWEGTVTTINPEVDPGTRNVRMRATVQNADGRLNPGMFASVAVKSGAEGHALVVPATSVVFAPYGDSVYVIEDSKDLKTKEGTPQPIARQRFVRLGERRGDYVAVLSGLAAGETVVSNGAFKLRNGQTVAVNNALAPPVQFVPAPVDR